MGKKWKDAHKLCQFILMYEPGNKTAREFMPLIESKLNSSESGDEEEDGDEEESEEETSSNESTSDSNSNSEESDESSDDKDKGENPGGKDQKLKEDYDDDDDVETPSSARLSKKKQAKEPFKLPFKFKILKINCFKALFKKRLLNADSTSFHVKPSTRNHSFLRKLFLIFIKFYE